MNKSYRSIWNESLGAWVATSEISRARGKRSGSAVRAAAASLLLMAGWHAGAQAANYTDAATGAICNAVGTPTAGAVGAWTCQVPNADGGYSILTRVDAGTGAGSVPTAATLATLAGVTRLGSDSVAIGTNGVDYTRATGTSAVAIGTKAWATENSSVAVGDGARATGYGAVAMGQWAQASGVYSVALGGGSKALGDSAYAMGNNSVARAFDVAIGPAAMFNSTGSTQNTALGYQAGAGSVDAIESTFVGVAAGAGSNGKSNAFVGSRAGGQSVGNLNVANGAFALAGVQGNANVAQGNGAGALVTGDRNVAIGRLAGSKVTVDAAGNPAVLTGATYSDAVNIGSQTQAFANNAVAVGTNALAGGNSAIAMGFTANASDIGAIAIGANTIAKQAGGNFGGSAIAIGNGASADGMTSAGVIGSAVAIGSGAVARGAGTTAIGSDINFRTQATSSGATAVGVKAVASGLFSSVIGSWTSASGDYAFAAGQGDASGEEAVAIGRGASASVADAIALGSSSSVTVAGGVALGSGSVASVAGGATGYNPASATVADKAAIQATNSTTLGAVSVGSGAAGGNRQIINLAAGTANSDAVNVAQLKAAQTHYYSVNSTDTAAGSNYANDGAIGLNAIAAGMGAMAAGKGSVAIGAGVNDSTVTEAGSVVIGGAIGPGTYNPALNGASNSGPASASVVIGSGASNQGAIATVVGTGASAGTIGGSTVVGSFASSTTTASAFGSSAKATAVSGVALGDQSVASVAGGAAGYNPASATVADKAAIQATNSTTLGAVSVGTGVAGGNRQIVNLAAGTNDADAVNVAQLKAAQSAATTHFYSVGSTDSTKGNYNNEGATGVNALAAGVGAIASQQRTTAVGAFASAVTDHSVAIGYRATADASGSVGAGGQSVAVGTAAKAGGFSSIAIGGSRAGENGEPSTKANFASPLATGQGSIAIGAASFAGATFHSTALGVDARAEADRSLALGDITRAQAVRSTAVGGSATVTVADGVALGSNSVASTAANGVGYAPAGASAAQKLAIAGTTIGTLAPVSIGSTTATRQIQNVAAGTLLSDAVNVAQLQAVSSAAAAGAVHYFSVNDTGAVRPAGDGTNNDNLGATGINSMAIGQNATAATSNSIAMGYGATLGSTGGVVPSNNAVAIGTQTLAYNQSVSLGYRAGYQSTGPGGSLHVNGGENVFIGSEAGAQSAMNDSTIVGAQAGQRSSGEHNTAMGEDAMRDTAGQGNSGFGTGAGQGTTAQKALGNQNTAIGYYAGTGFKGDNNTASGTQSGQNVTGDRNIAMGYQAGRVITASDTIAFGSSARASKDNAIAIGNGAQATAIGAVALGSGSVASTAANGVGYEPAGASAAQKLAIAGTTIGTLAPVSIGSTTATRQIQNVAAGTLLSDAVNVAQLQAVSAAAAAGEVHYYSANDGGVQQSNFDNKGALGANSVAAGPGASTASTAIGSVALGYNATAGGVGSGALGVAIGQSATAYGGAAIGIGYQAGLIDAASVNPNDSSLVAVGASAGYQAKSGSDGAGVSSAVFLGTNAGSYSQGYRNNFLGANAGLNSGSAITFIEVLPALPANVITGAPRGGNVNDAGHNLGLGDEAFTNSQGNWNTAVGTASLSGANGQRNTAQGFYSGFKAQGDDNVAVGYMAGVIPGATAAAAPTTLNANRTISVGRNAMANADDAVAIGYLASATKEGGVALGSNSVDKAFVQVSSATIPGVIATLDANGTVTYTPGPALTYGGFAGTATGVVSVGAAGAERQIVNVAPGAITPNSTDAINGSQLYSVASQVNALGGSITTIVNNASSHFYSVNGGTKVDGNYANDGATAQGAIASGINASATAANGVAMGTGATASTANSVALGAGSTTTAATPTASTTIRGTTYNFAGANPDGVVSVGSAGAERQIQNVAAGQISASSTDAINGSQLYATNLAIESISAVAGAGINVTTAATGTGIAIGTSVANVGPGGVATYTAGNNMVLTQNGSNTTFAVNDNPNFNSVTVGNVSITNSGINAGGNVVSNVAPGVAGTDAVNVNQLNSASAANNAYTDARVNGLGNEMRGIAKNAYAGVAAAMAVQMPGSYVPGKTVMRIGGAVFKGESAVGVSFRRTAENNGWSVTGGVGLSRAGAAVTAGVEWVFN